MSPYIGRRGHSSTDTPGGSTSGGHSNADAKKGKLISNSSSSFYSLPIGASNHKKSVDMNYKHIAKRLKHTDHRPALYL